MFKPMSVLHKIILFHIEINIANRQFYNIIHHYPRGDVWTPWYITVKILTAWLFKSFARISSNAMSIRVHLLTVHPYKLHISHSQNIRAHFSALRRAEKSRLTKKSKNEIKIRSKCKCAWCTIWVTTPFHARCERPFYTFKFKQLSNMTLSWTVRIY